MSSFVLVHGAWGGAWIWRRVIGPLRAAGHEVHAVTLTGDGERLVPIAGTVPPPDQWPDGCRFHPRCPVAIARCATERPPLAPVGDRHLAACWVAQGATP